jgi:glycosyltransferase involved in cell wall biosynthesis
MITPYTNRLYNEVARRGTNIHILSCSRQEPNRNWADDIEPEYEHTVLPGMTLRLSENRYAHLNNKILATLNLLSPDLLIINGFYPSMCVAAVWAAVTRTRLALTIDGWAHNMPKSFYHRIIRPIILRQCLGVIVPGAKGKEFFETQGFLETQIFTVPLVPAWNGPIKPKKFGERQYHLLWAAQMNDDVKNIDFFMRVVRAAKPKIQDLRVRLVGRGPASARVLQELQLEGISYQYEPVVEWTKMSDVFSSARVLLLPSLWEPWGLVCNEALQCGTPCIVSPFVGAGNDLVIAGCNGDILPLQVKDWLESLLSLCTNENNWKLFSCRALESMRSRGITESAMAFERAIGNMLASSNGLE